MKPLLDVRSTFRPNPETDLCYLLVDVSGKEIFIS
jgi:hypothetical protein